MTDQKDHEKAVDDFVAADKAFKDYQEQFLDGTLVEQIAATGRPDTAKAQWEVAVRQLRALLEDRNAKYTTAAQALRAAVQIAPTQWRGPDSKAHVLNYGPAKVSSVTHRGFDPEALIRECQKKGILERLLQLTYTTKDGQQENAMKQVWEYDYETILKWLKLSKLEDVLQASYDEKDKTPMVTGIKRLTFLGENKD